MESRIREGQSKLIDVFALLIRSENEDRIDWCYPENGLNEELKRNVAKFAFPFRGNFKSSNVDYFTFVLTDIDGKFKFGFCRMSAGSESTLCLISSYPWFEIFYKILNHLSDALNSTNGSLQDLLDQLCEIDPSAHGKKSVSYKVLEKQFTIHYPDPDKLPSIPESRNLTEYYNAIDGQNMLTIFASMLFERRIIVTSHKLSRLTACVYGATSLIYPLNWQHIFIPVLPYHLIDYISAPMPYLIGVHSSVFEMAKPSEIADAMIVDADARKVTCSHEDLAALPVGIVSSLKKDLNLHRNDNHCCLTGDKLSQAFLKAMVSLIGGYRTAVVLEGGQIGFDSDIFLNSHPDSMQAFLRMILQSQSFEQFVAERLTISRFTKGFSDVFEKAALNAETTGKQNKASVKKKINHLIQDKVLVDIRNKVKSTSVKTFSSVKKKLDFKKNEGVNHVKGKATTATKEFAVQSKTSAEEVSKNLAETNLSGNMTDGRQTLPSDLLRQRSTSRSTAVEKRDVRFLDDNEYDVLDVWRQQSTSDFSLMPLDRTSLFKKFSFDDLEISGLDLDRDIVNLSAVSFESCHNLSGSKVEQTSTEYCVDDSKVIMRSRKECINDSDSVCVNGGVSHTYAAEEEDSQDESSDGDSLFELPSFDNSVVGNSETAARKSLFKIKFPSVQNLQRTLQVSSPVRRKAVVSVQELPNVKQMVQRLEASSNLQKTKADAPHLDIGASHVAQQAAALLNRGSRTSLTRKHAIRATGQTRKASGDEYKDIGAAPVSEKRSSLMAKSERFHDLIDSVKKERNYISPDFDPQPNAFGCLLRVSSRAASIRQFDMQQRQFSCVKRPSPPSDRTWKQLQDSRRAIYDSESKTAAAEEIPFQSRRSALYIPSESVFETKTDVNDGPFDLAKNEVIINLPLSNNAADASFNSTGSFVATGNQGALYIPCELNPSKDPGSDCAESSEPSQNRVSLCIPLDDYPAEDAVSFMFRLPGGGSSEKLNNQSALCLQKEEDPHYETEILSADDWCSIFSSWTYESECELVSKDITSVHTSSQLVPENGSVKDENHAYERHCLLHSAAENGVLKRPADLCSASHQPQSVDQTKESYENFVSFTIHETPESSDDNSR